MDDELRDPAADKPDETPKEAPDKESPDDTAVLEAAAVAEPDDEDGGADEPEPIRSSAPVDGDAFTATAPWESPGRPRNAIIGAVVTLALVGVVGLVGWVLFGQPDDEGPTGSLGDPTGACELRTVDELPGGGGTPDFSVVAERMTATITTNHGPVTALLFGDLAPCGTGSFAHLASIGYYTAVDCPSMSSAMTEPTLVLRCGPPAAEGGPGYRVRGEHPFSGAAVVDALALVNDGNGLAGAEFALIRGQSVPTNDLTVIGQVIDGFEVLDQITASGGAGVYSGPPPVPVQILSVVVQQGTVTTGPSGGTGSGLGGPTPTAATPTPTAPTPTAPTPTTPGGGGRN